MHRRSKKPILLKRKSNHNMTVARTSIEDSTAKFSQPVEPNSESTRTIESQANCRERRSPRQVKKHEMSLFSRQYRKHRSLDLDLKCFRDMNNEVNLITQKRAEYEFVAVRHCVTSALTNAAHFKNDLIEMQKYEKFVSPQERTHLVETLTIIEEAITTINQIIIGRKR